MGFRSDYWSLYASGLRDVSLVHGLLLIRHLLDVPEVVESDLADFFGDLEDVYTREIFCRFALATEGGGYGPHPRPRISPCRDRVGPPAHRGGHALALSRRLEPRRLYLTKYHFLLGSFTNLYIWRLETCPALRCRLH